MRRTKERTRPEGAILVVLDIECTCCDQGSIPPDRMETIQIGAVAIELSTQRELGHFAIDVRPTERPVLTDFCTALTGIEQSRIDAAKPFGDALQELEVFLASHGAKSFAAWGAFDFLQLRREARRTKTPFFCKEHLNLKRTFRKLTGFKTEVSLVRALSHYSLDFDGTQHDALVDARNTARLLPFLFPEDPPSVAGDAP